MLFSGTCHIYRLVMFWPPCWNIVVFQYCAKFFLYKNSISMRLRNSSRQKCEVGLFFYKDSYNGVTYCYIGKIYCPNPAHRYTVTPLTDTHRQ